MLRHAVGAVIRDSSGNFLAVGNDRLDWCCDVLTAEVSAIKYGLIKSGTIYWPGVTG